MTMSDTGAGVGGSAKASAAAALEHLTAVLVGPRPTVLVVGDVMLDEYVEGTSDRISPEAPVPIINVAEVRDHLGGAANVARQVSALGGSPVLVGVIGEDAAGERVRDHCAQRGIDASGLVVAADRVTTTKQRITVGRQQVARLDREVTAAVRGSIEERLVEHIASATRPDAIVVSDYAKGALTPRVLDAVMSAAERWNVPVLVDPKHRDFGRYRGATVIKVNHVEFESAVGHRLAVDDVAEAMATVGRELIGSAEVRHLIVTLTAVDAVVPFESSGLEELIRAVGPDVLVKGSDYRSAEVVGAAWVEAQGGSVELVTVLPEWSTTSLVDKIRDGG